MNARIFCFLLLFSPFGGMGQSWQAKIDSLQEEAAYHQALALLEGIEGASMAEGRWEDYTHACNRQAHIYAQMGLFDTAFVVINKSIEAIEKEANSNASLAIDAQNTLGLIHLNKGRNDLAMQAFQKAWRLSVSTHGNQPHAQTAQSLSNLALVNFDLDNTNEALDLHTQALNMRQTLFGNMHTAVAASYNDMGLLFASSDADKALEYYGMASKIYTEVYGSGHPKVANTYINIGNIYLRQQVYFKALESFEQALAMLKKTYGDNHPNVAFALGLLGDAYTNASDFVQGRAFLNQSLAIYQQVYGNRHPQVAQILLLLADIDRSEGKLKDALNRYQMALVANSLAFDSQDYGGNPAGDDYANPMLMLNLLLRKGGALEEYHYIKSLKFSDLEKSLQSLEACDALLQRIRQQRNSKADKLALGQYAVDLYERAIKLCLAMAQVTPKSRFYREKAFEFSEKSKAATLLASISDTKAKQFANIPEALLEEERTLQASIALLERQLAGNLPEEERANYQRQLFAERQTYQAFVAELEMKFPAYFNLKYNVRMASVADLQQRLQPSQALFSFFIAEGIGRIYVFRIDRKGLRVWDVAKHADFEKWLVGFENGVLFQVDQVVAHVGQQLFAQLFPKGSLKGVGELLLVPDGMLGKLPFEALLASYCTKDLPEDAISMPFLAKQYAVSYAYSATLYAQSKPMQILNENAQMMLCAPINFEGEGMRAFLSDLPGTAAEVADISGIAQKANVEATVYMRDKAQENALKNTELAKYDYVHFATHGTVNEEQPELSQLFLQAGNGDDGDLYAGEIYTLQLRAHLVVLSACETGLGKITKGEGMIGLSRALIYAGAENLVVSLWSVSDASTAELIGHFYEYALSRKLPYRQAMRQAKRELMNNPGYASPYYWAPFILIGE